MFEQCQKGNQKTFSPSKKQIGLAIIRQLRTRGKPDPVVYMAMTIDMAKPIRDWRWNLPARPAHKKEGIEEMRIWKAKKTTFYWYDFTWKGVRVRQSTTETKETKKYFADHIS